MTQQNYPAMMVTGLYKKFGDKIAVNNLNLTVPRGSIFGIVGPNGAGKTTMLNMATGLLRPDAGQAIICGFDMWHDPIPAKAAMGLLADGLPVFDRLTGEEYLQYLGALRGIPEADLAPRISELLHALGLEEATDKYIADYSAGMTKKILLAGALIHNPDVLILDEPLEAVDPVSSRVIQQILRAYAAAGGTVILSSHVMELVEGLCDRVAIIHHGTVRLEGDVKELAAQTSLTDLFVSIVGGGELTEGQLQWLQHNQPEQPLGQPYPPGQPDQRGMQPEQPNQPRRFGRQEPPQPASTARMGEPDDLGSEPTEQFDVSALRSVEPPRTSPPYPLRMAPKHPTRRHCRQTSCAACATRGLPTHLAALTTTGRAATIQLAAPSGATRGKTARTHHPHAFGIPLLVTTQPATKPTPKLSQPTPIRAATTTIFHQPHTDRNRGRDDGRNGDRGWTWAILPRPALFRESLHRPIPTNQLLPACRGNPGPHPNPTTLRGVTQATHTKPATTIAKTCATGIIGARKTRRQPSRTTKTPLQ